MVVVTGSVGTSTVTWNTATKAGTYRVDVYNMPVGHDRIAHPRGRRRRGRSGHHQLHRPGRRHLERLRSERHLRLHRRHGAAPRRASTRARTSNRRCLLNNTYVNVHSTDESRRRNSRTIDPSVAGRFNGSRGSTNPLNFHRARMSKPDETVCRDACLQRAGHHPHHRFPRPRRRSRFRRQGARHRRRRIQGRHPRNPQGTRRQGRRPGVLPAPQPGQGRRGVARHPRVDRRHGDHPGRRSRIRPARVSGS